MSYSTKSLKSIIKLVIDNRGRNPKSYVEDGIPIIDNYLITSNGKVNLANVKRFIDEETYNSFLRKYVQEDDVLMTLVGNGYGQVAITPKEKCAIIQNTIGLRCDDNNNNKFLYYLLSNHRESFLNLNRGAAQPSIKVGDVLELEFKFPPLQTQKKIAHILSTLDDKIELGRKMNQTLESMAQTLFKSWFVDFDPIHAKMRCKNEEELKAVAKELGISKEILELFPSEFEESELGMIPKGWENDYLESFVEILDNKRIPLSSQEREKRKGNIPYYGATSVMDYVDDYLFNEPLALMGEDGSVARENGTPFMQYIWGKSWVNNHAHVMKSKSYLSIEAIYIALLNQNVRMFITGAVQPKINQGNLKKIPLINAGKNIFNAYSNLLLPMFGMIRIKTEETKTLQKTRDTLLSKLLSGEIDVSELEI